MSRTVAYYNGKAVSMDHITDPKQRFSLACARVLDNAKDGYVLDGSNLYFLSPASRMAKIVRDAEKRGAILAEIAALVAPKE